MRAGAVTPTVPRPSYSARPWAAKRGVVIRPTQATDKRAILALASRTGVFKPHEITALEEVLGDFHNTNTTLDHRAITFEEHGEILGFAYYAPASMADRTWYLYWIAVTKQTQARGIGTQLLQLIEEDIRSRRGRILLVETSSLPYYDLTREILREAPVRARRGDQRLLRRRRQHGDLFEAADVSRRAARIITTCVAILASHPCDDAAR